MESIIKREENDMQWFNGYIAAMYDAIMATHGDMGYTLEELLESASKMRDAVAEEEAEKLKAAEIAKGVEIANGIAKLTNGGE